MASLRSATAIALAESLLVHRLMSHGFLPRYAEDSTADYLRITLIILLINYAFLILWRTLISPIIYDPFRDIPKVKSFLWRAAFARYVRTELMFDLSRETPNNGIIALWEVFRYRLLLTNVDTTTELLVHRSYDFVKPSNIRHFMTRMVGSGLVVLEGDRHKALRKDSLQAFAPRQVQRLYPSMWDKAMILVGEIEKELNRHSESNTGREPGIVEMANWAYKATADIIGITVLGLGDHDSLRSPDSPLMRSFKIAIGPGLRFYRILAVWLSFEFVEKLPWKKNGEFKESTETMKSICRQIVYETKQTLKVKGDDNEEASSKILANLIRTEEFSDTELADQLLTYLIAGHDTTQSAFLWVCYLLSKHSEWQRTLREELVGVVPTLNESVHQGASSLDNLEKLPYLNGVINEALRLYPVIPLTSRIAICDTSIGGKPIPKGTEVLVSPWIINRALESWGDTASVFDPSRWIDGGRPNTHGKTKNHHDLMTFLHGPRSCIGVHFAKAELRCLVASMVTRFDWTLGMPDSEVVPGGVISITPLQGLRLKLRRVDRT